MNWNNVQIVPTFVDQGVSCYQLEGGDFKNEYIFYAENIKLRIFFFYILP